MNLCMFFIRIIYSRILINIFLKKDVLNVYNEMLRDFIYDIKFLWNNNYSIMIFGEIVFIQNEIKL